MPKLFEYTTFDVSDSTIYISSFIILNKCRIQIPRSNPNIIEIHSLPPNQPSVSKIVLDDNLLSVYIINEMRYIVAINATKSKMYIIDVKPDPEIERFEQPQLVMIILAPKMIDYIQFYEDRYILCDSPHISDYIERHFNCLDIEKIADCVKVLTIIDENTPEIYIFSKEISIVNIGHSVEINDIIYADGFIYYTTFIAIYAVDIQEKRPRTITLFEWLSSTVFMSRNSAGVVYLQTQRGDDIKIYEIIKGCISRIISIFPVEFKQHNFKIKFASAHPYDAEKIALILASSDESTITTGIFDLSSVIPTFIHDTTFPIKSITGIDKYHKLKNSDVSRTFISMRDKSKKLWYIISSRGFNKNYPVETFRKLPKYQRSIIRTVILICGLYKFPNELTYELCEYF
jgi:hypothetical protein